MLDALENAPRNGARPVSVCNSGMFSNAADRAK